jgi:hypothetical protein
MKRSEFIQLSAFAAAAISLPLLNSCSPADSKNAMSQPVFLSRLFDEKTMNDVGMEYLQKVPGENDQEKLVQILADNNKISESSDIKEIHQYLDQKIRQDFETGKTVLVKGWVLSFTEARQCALFSLVNS